MSDWDMRFLALARHVAEWSKDRSRKVGCVIVGPDHEVRSLGYNGFPRGVNDDAAERYERPAKYSWTEHAERNAIYNAARIGVSLRGCTAYLPWYPCMDCARALVQAGIWRLVCGQEPDLNDPKWGADFAEVPNLLREGGILYIETSFADWITLNDNYCDPAKGHCTIFSHDALIGLLKGKGFELAAMVNRNTLVFKKVSYENNRDSTPETGDEDREPVSGQ